MVRRAAFRTAAGLVLLLAGALMATDHPGDRALFPPMAGAPTVDLFLVSNGFHTGLLVPRPALDAVAQRLNETATEDVATRFGAYRWVEIGWGEEQFYRFTPTLAALGLGRAFRALFLDNRTVLHVVGVDDLVELDGPHAALMRVPLSPDGFDRLTERLDATFARAADGSAIDLGPGLYGPSRFFRANGRMSVTDVCNSWVGRLLNAAGLPDAPVLSIFAPGLIAGLRWRANLTLLRQR